MAGIGEESPESPDSRGSVLKKQKKLKGEDEFRFVHGKGEIEEVVEKEEQEDDDDDDYEGERVNEGEEEEEEEEKGGVGEKEVAEEEEDEVIEEEGEDEEEEEEWEEEEGVDEDGEGEKEGSRSGQKLEEEEEEEETSSVFLSDDDEEEDVGDYCGSDPEELKDGDEEVKRYIRQLNESQGFYVDSVPVGLKWMFGVVFPVDFDDEDDEYHMKNAHTCVKEAVNRYNKKKMKNLEFVRIMHVTRTACAGSNYAITFEAKNLSSGEILMYQTRVYHGIRGQMLVSLFRRKRGDALKYS